MNDHSNATTYTYDDAGRLSTITSPGSKTWDYDYNALGQPTQYEHPNGMKTYYSYDTRNRMTKIEHKDGETVEQSFTYALDDTGNITRTTNEDGSLWDYEYDGRYRLTKAERDNASTPTITATYEYTYDDGDNLVTKVMPWIDDFQDGNYTGWSTSGAWSVTDGVMENTVDPDSWSSLYRSQSDANIDVRFTYANYDTSNSTYRFQIKPRHEDESNYLYVDFHPSNAYIKEKVGGNFHTRDSASISTTEDALYDVRLVVDGDDITVWRGSHGGQMTEILSYGSLVTDTTSQLLFRSYPESTYGVDNIELIADNFSTTTTLAYNNANELTSMSEDGSATVSFTYDEWGRTISKYTTNDSADYYYRYGAKLYSVTSDFPDEGTVTYDYGGDQKRRQRTVGGTSTWYNWAGWNVINEESGSGSGSLTMTYVGNMAQVPGSTPSTGSYAYYVHDNLGSTRGLWAQDKSPLGVHEYAPYGSDYSRSGETVDFKWTGRLWDPLALLYYGSQYDPKAGRYLTRPYNRNGNNLMGGVASTSDLDDPPPDDPPEDDGHPRKKQSTGKSGKGRHDVGVARRVKERKRAEERLAEIRKKRRNRNRRRVRPKNNWPTYTVCEIIIPWFEPRVPSPPRNPRPPGNVSPVLPQPFPGLPIHDPGIPKPFR